MDRHVVASSLDDIHGWLDSTLRAERAALTRQLEERHQALLSEFRSRLQVGEVAPGSAAAVAAAGERASAPPALGASEEPKCTPRAKTAWGERWSVVTPTGNHKDDAHGMRTTPSVVRLFNMFTASEQQLMGHNRPAIKTVYGRFEAFVKSQRFELVFATVILLNAVFMAMHLQYKGIDIGFELEYRTYTRSAVETWPRINKGFVFVDEVFTVIFAFELLMRVLAYRVRCLCLVWTYIDAVIVGLGFYAWLFPRALDMNPTIVRLIRFGKLMRIVRLMRSHTVLDSLKILVTAIQASVHTLFWSLCTLLVIQSVAGMMMTQFLDQYMRDESQPLETRQAVFSYYGTFWRVMVTMFEITFANWAPPCRLLLNEVDETYGAFFLIYRCSIGFAVLSVIQAVFIQQTMKAAQADDDFLLEEKEREKQKNAERLRRIFARMDKSGDGFVTWSEFEPLLKEDQFKLVMSAIGVDVSDLKMLFHLLDNGDGEFSSQDFVRGMTQIKGPAKAVDVVTLVQAVKRIEAKLGTKPDLGLTVM